MYCIGELLEICNKSLNKKMYISIEGDIFLMKCGHYIVDNIWYSEISKICEETFIGKDFINECEKEIANDDNWGDLYTSPMEHLGDCEIKFTNDMTKLITEESYEDCFEIVNIKENENDIVLELELIK